MIRLACLCGQSDEVPDSMAGSMTQCPACGSALLVPPATRTITRCRSWAGKAGVWLATLILCACIGVVAGTLYWVLYLKLDGKGVGKALQGEVEDALPALQALILLGGMVGGVVGLMYRFMLMTRPDASPPELPLPRQATQPPGPVGTEETRTRKAQDG
jgi:hypothetical protein